MVMLPAAPPTVSRAARRPEAESARCQPKPSPSSYLPPFWPSGVQSAVDRAAKLSPGRLCSCQCQDCSRSGSAATTTSAAPSPCCNAAWARSHGCVLVAPRLPFWTLSRCQVWTWPPAARPMPAGAGTENSRCSSTGMPVAPNGTARMRAPGEAPANLTRMRVVLMGARPLTRPPTPANPHLVSLSCQLHANARIGRAPPSSIGFLSLRGT